MRNVNAGQRYTFTAKAGKYGRYGSMAQGTSLLLMNLRVNGKQARSHCWVSHPEIKALKGVKTGDMVTFSAEVRAYPGIDENYKQVIKLGLHKIYNVKVKR